MGIAALGSSLSDLVFSPLITQLLAHTDNDWRLVFQLIALTPFCLIFYSGLLSLKVINLQLPVIVFISIFYNVGDVATDLGIKARQRVGYYLSIATSFLTLPKIDKPIAVSTP